MEEIAVNASIYSLTKENNDDTNILIDQIWIQNDYSFPIYKLPPDIMHSHIFAFFSPEMFYALNFTSKLSKNLVQNYLNKYAIKVNSHYTFLKIHCLFDNNFKFINNNLTMIEFVPKECCNDNCPHYKARDCKFLWNSKNEIIDNSCVCHKEQMLKDFYIKNANKHHAKDKGCHVKHRCVNNYCNIKKIIVYPNTIEDLYFLKEIPSTEIIIKCCIKPYYISESSYISWLTRLYTINRMSRRSHTIILYFDDKLVWRKIGLNFR
jgi:hypothetical protein